MIAQANGSKSKLVNAQDVAATFRLFVRPGCIAEVRALDATTRSDSWRPSTFSGYFDDAEKLATAVSELASVTGIYFTFNEPDPALLARAVNRLRKSDKGTTTSDGRGWVARSRSPRTFLAYKKNFQTHLLQLHPTTFYQPPIEGFNHA